MTLAMRSMFACATLIGLTACASAPTAMEPDARTSAVEEIDPVPGTVFIYDDGRVERYLRRDDDELIWATRNGREYNRAANPALPILSWDIGGRSGRREVFGDADAIWPPQGGARGRFRVLTEVSEGTENRRYSQAWSCEVANPLKVTVPAGDFLAYEINCERFSVNSMRLLEKRTWWWAEDLGHVVQRRFQDLRDGEVNQIALCGALPELRASEARIEAILNTC